MMRVHSTWASGANAMAVPWWPERAAFGASIANPRMTSIARRSSSSVVSLGEGAPAMCSNFQVAVRRS
jgi:hypothetical protein